MKPETEWNPKPWSYWLVWYECLLAIVHIDNTGKYFFAHGQEPLWCISNAQPIREITIDDREQLIAAANLPTP